MIQQKATATKGTISIQSLHFCYEGSLHPVLENLSLEIPTESVTAILGPNGSGKTTLLHLLLGILSPTRGSIRIADRMQHQYSRRSLSQTIGLVPQEESIPFDFAVVEYVLLGRAPYMGLLAMPKEGDRRAALAALEAAGVTHLQQRSITSLSGGERQLATIARALAQDPEVLLLDEPTSHLDLGNKRRVLTVLRNMANAGKTVVFSTHDPDAVAQMADFVVLMLHGKIVSAGPINEVLTTENLTLTYGVPVEVVRVQNRPVVLLQ